MIGTKNYHQDSAVDYEVHSQESKPESFMTAFCIIPDYRPVTDMYHRFVVVVMIHI